MSRIKLTGLLLAFVLLPFAAHAADISGTWKASFDTQIGKQEYTYTFVVKGAVLTGKAKSANGESDLQDGKVDADTVSFVETFKFQDMPLKVTYTGKIISAKEIKFTRDVGGFAKEELTATRSN